MQDSFSEDDRSTSELIARAVKDVDSAETRRIVTALHRRGANEEFDAAVRLTQSESQRERRLGARILGQLGKGRKYHSHSVRLLRSLLGDHDPTVVAAAAVALSHRHDPRAVPDLLRLCQHPDAGVRHGVAVALGGHERADAIAALIRLSSDSDREVRSWATLGLGSLTELDDEGIRAALLLRISDTDPEIRGEALIGLARRAEPRVSELVRDELRRPFAGDWSVEAAEILADQTLHDGLEALWCTLDVQDRDRYRAGFERAFKACSPTRKR